MRNDDPEYLNQLERGLATAEEEIKILEDEVVSQFEIIRRGGAWPPDALHYDFTRKQNTFLP